MRTVSVTMLQAMLAPETGEAPIILLTIDHASLSVPIRVTDFDVDVTSRSNEFVALPFLVTLPTDTDEAAPRARVQIDNISREIVIAVRNATGDPPTVLMELVLNNSRDAVEASFDGFVLRDVRYDSMTIEGDLTLDAQETEPYPAGSFTPAAFPGVH